jgi:hypothetical protein
MKLPAKIRVNGYDCRFVRDRAVYDVDGLFGDFDPNKNTIRIAEPDQFADEIMEAGTVIHEWVHAMVALSNIKVSDEEALVEALEAALVQGLRDNKTFARSIIRALK